MCIKSSLSFLDGETANTNSGKNTKTKTSVKDKSKSWMQRSLHAVPAVCSPYGALACWNLHTKKTSVETVYLAAAS